MAVTASALSTDAKIIRMCDRINEWGLYLILFLIPVFFIIYTRDQFELPKLTILRIITSIMLGSWLTRILAARRFEFRRTPLDLPILIWTGLQILTTIFTVSPSVSLLGEYENFRGLLTVLNYVILYFLAVNFLRTREQIQRLLLAIILSGLLVTAYGVAQFFGIDVIAWNPQSVASGRYFSSLGNPNFLAAYLAMVMPWLVVFFIETDSTFRRGILLICFLVMFTALLGTWSRGGFLGLCAAFAVLAAFGMVRAYRYLQNQAGQKQISLPAMFQSWLKNNKGLALTLTCVAIIVLTLTLTFGRHHMARTFDTIIHLPAAIKVSRLHIWGPALGMIRDFPLLGTGLDTFKTIFPRYATPAFAAIDGANVSSRTAHNEILQVLATQGVIGFLIVAGLTVMILLNWWKAYKRSAANWQDRLLVVGLLTTWTAYSVQNLFSFGVVAIDTFYWIIIALIVLLQVKPEEQPQLTPSVQPAAKPGSGWMRLGSLRYPLMVGAGMISVWLAVLSFNIAWADYLYNLGTVYRMRNLWDYSLQTFAQASKLLPLEVKYVVYEGLAYEEKAKSLPQDQQLEWVQKALQAYQKGAAMNPTNAYYLGNVGRALAYASLLEPDNPKYYQEAITTFKSAIQYAPVTVLFYQNLALLYFDHKQYSDFYQVAEQLAKFNPDEAAQLCFNAANQAYNLDELAVAKESYSKAIYYKPKYVEALFNLGVTYARFNQIPDAVKCWQQALATRPDFSPAQQMLERYQSAVKDLPQSILGR